MSVPVVGFGPPKVADDLYVWLVAASPPSDDDAAAAIATQGGAWTSLRDRVPPG